MIRPTLKQMRRRPTLWYNEFTDTMLIVYPDIYTQEYYDFICWELKGACASVGVLHVHWTFLGFL